MMMSSCSNEWSFNPTLLPTGHLVDGAGEERVLAGVLDAPSVRFASRMALRAPHHTLGERVPQTESLGQLLAPCSARGMIVRSD
jgi:hypothetical protein